MSVASFPRTPLLLNVCELGVFCKTIVVSFQLLQPLVDALVHLGAHVRTEASRLYLWKGQTFENLLLVLTVVRGVAVAAAAGFRIRFRTLSSTSRGLSLGTFTFPGTFRCWGRHIIFGPFATLSWQRDIIELFFCSKLKIIIIWNNKVDFSILSRKCFDWEETFWRSCQERFNITSPVQLLVSM